MVRAISAGELDAAISSLVPLEISNAMRKYGHGGESGPEVESIMSLGMQVIPLEASDVEEVGGVMADNAAGPYDCAHAILMRRYGITEVISADKDFDKFEWVRRIDPKGAIAEG